MYHSRIFHSDHNYRRSSFQCPPFPNSLLAAPQDRPLFVQFCSNTPHDFLSAAKHVAPFCDAVDLNLGCPQGIARKGHYGSFLQEEWDLIKEMIGGLHKELSVPVTAKIRIQENKEKTLEYAKMILEAGASIITVHGRRRDQKGQLTGLADWSYIRYLRDNLPPDTVIFANGNIRWQEDIEDCLRETGADAVMSAETNLCNPTGLFLPSSAPWEDKFPRMDLVARRYLEIIREKIMPPLISNAKTLKKKERGDTDECLTAIKSHLFKVLHCLLPVHTEIRNQLGRSTTRRGWGANELDADKILEDFEKVVQMVEKAVQEELEKNPEEVDAEGKWVGPDVDGGTEGYDMGNGVRRKIPYYRCQPQIRPSPEEAYAAGAIKLPTKKKGVQTSRPPVNAPVAEEGEERSAKRQKLEEVPASENVLEVTEETTTTENVCCG